MPDDHAGANTKNFTKESSEKVLQPSDRGLLDLSVELSVRDIIAGKEFAIFVLVKNPFSRPLWIQRVHVSLPSELGLAEGLRTKKQLQEADETVNQQRIQADQRREALLKGIGELKKQVEQLDTTLANRGDYINLQRAVNEIRDDLHDIKKNLEQGDFCKASLNVEGYGNIGSIRVAASTSAVNVINNRADADVSIGELRLGAGSLSELEIADPRVLQDERARSRDIELESSLSRGVALQPGCTAVYTGPLNARSRWFFSPSKYRLQFNVVYSFDFIEDGGVVAKHADVLRIFANTLSEEISIRPSVISVGAGAICGGFVGAIARFAQIASPADFRTYAWPDYASGVVSLMLALILSAIAVVFLSRKSDAQSFVSVEDIWGGLLIGFFVGYTGTAFFTQLTGSVLHVPAAPPLKGVPAP
jgi:hypothetical protein